MDPIEKLIRKFEIATEVIKDYEEHCRSTGETPGLYGLRSFIRHKIESYKKDLDWVNKNEL